ncbi:hypothetical protein KMZ27_03745 [Pseudomonas shirazica]|nr:hypothetical protein [Pseudomonas shirazica]
MTFLEFSMPRRIHPCGAFEGAAGGTDIFASINFLLQVLIILGMVIS